MRGLLVGLCAAVSWAALTGGAQAQSTEPERRQACTGDAFKFCALDIPDRQKIAQCLANNRERLNPDCRAVIDGGRSQTPRRR